MAMNLGAVRAWMSKYRVQSEAVGVALLALVASLVVGMKAQQALLPLRTDLKRLEGAASEVSAFRSTFEASTPEQETRIGRLAESLTVVVPRDYRVAVAREISEIAEDVGLSDVRVRIAPVDSAPPPPVPELSRSTVSVADYSLTISCSGAFADVLNLVNQLPPSVALQRIIGDSGSGKKTQFYLGLAVLESAAGAAVPTSTARGTH